MNAGRMSPGAEIHFTPAHNEKSQHGNRLARVILLG
jgi:hypothetical protein